MYDARHDRSGRDLTRYDDLLAFGGNTGYANGEDVPQWFSQPSLSAPIDAERLRFDRLWDIGLKQTRKRGEEGEQRITAGYVHTNESQQTGNTTQYYFDAGNPETTDESSDLLMKNDRLYVDFTQSTNDSTAYGSEYFLLEGTRKDGLSRQESTALGTVTERVTTPQVRLSNTFKRVWPTERCPFSVESVVDFRHAPMKMSVDGDANRLYTTLFHTDEAVSLTLYRPFLTHKYTARLKAEHIRVRGGSTLLTASAQPWWQYKNRNLRAILNVPVAWNVFTRQDKQTVDYSPSIYVGWKSRSRHELYGLFGYTKKTALKTSNVSQRTLLGWTQRVSYAQSIGKIDLTAAAVHYRNELQTGEKVNTFLADASAVVRLSKVRLSLSARNLCNKRDYTITSYDGVTAATSWYRLRPREVV